jgi:dihydrofolate reductase
VADSIEKAIIMAAETDCREVFIAGGGEIYQRSLPLTHRIYLTRVHNDFPDAEIFYPEIRGTEWKLLHKLDFPADEKHAWSYSFETWER